MFITYCTHSTRGHAVTRTVVHSQRPVSTGRRALIRQKTAHRPLAAVSQPTHQGGRARTQSESARPFAAQPTKSRAAFPAPLGHPAAAARKKAARHSQPDSQPRPHGPAVSARHALPSSLAYPRSIPAQRNLPAPAVPAAAARPKPRASTRTILPAHSIIDLLAAPHSDPATPPPRQPLPPAAEHAARPRAVAPPPS